MSVRKPEQPRPRVLGGILAGGMGRRMDGLDKGLLPLNCKPMAQHVIERLEPQVDALIINANRSQDRYLTFGYPVIADNLKGFQGPLAGMEALLRAANSATPQLKPEPQQKLQHAGTARDNGHRDTSPEHTPASDNARDHTQCEVAGIVTAPCDAPYLPEDLVTRLTAHFSEEGIDRGAVASVEGRLQPVFAYLPVSALASLQAALTAGERKIDRWFAQENFLAINFSDIEQFSNLNTPADLAAQTQLITHTRFGAPVVGISAPSGTGKTTFLTGLLPRLKAAGLTVGVIKRAHHDVEVDKPGKDSFEIRHAGADRVLLAAHTRWALMVETPDAAPAEPAELVARIESPDLDLVLIEGFDLQGVHRVVLARERAGESSGASGVAGAAGAAGHSSPEDGRGKVLARFSDRPAGAIPAPGTPASQEGAAADLSAVSASNASSGSKPEDVLIGTSQPPDFDLNNIEKAAEFFIQYVKNTTI